MTFPVTTTFTSGGTNPLAPRITGVPASATQVKIEFLDATGAAIPGIGGTVALAASITFNIPSASAALIRSERVTFLSATGLVVGGVQSALTVTGPTTDAVTATTASSTLTAVAVNPGSATLSNATSTQQFTATGTFTVTGFSSPVTSNVTGAAVAFSSSNTSVVTVTNTGLATAAGVGSANVIASVTSGTTVNGTANVTVTSAPPPAGSPSPGGSPPPVTSNVTITAVSNNILVGATTQLTVTVGAGGTNTNQTANSTFSTSNASVATVSATGVVTGVAAGTAQMGAVVNVNGTNVTAVPNITITVGTPAPVGLTLNPATTTTVVGGRVTILGSTTVNGSVVQVPITLTVNNSTIAQVQGQVLVGLAAGTTNYTGTAVVGGANQTATGTLTVATGASLTGMVIDAGAAGFTMAEGDQRQFKALAQFTVSGGGTAQSDVTPLAVWTVANGVSGDTGTVVSFEPSTAGNFTATKGTGGTAQIACIYMDGTRTVVTNAQTITINKSTPTITINPTGVPLETNNSQIPATGFVRCFEARATYASSGFNRLLGAGDSVSWQITSGQTVVGGATNQLQGTAVVAASGKAEVQSTLKANTALTLADFGPAALNVSYGGAATPTTSSAVNNLGITNYTLLGCTGALSPGLPGDKGAIAGTGAKGYGRAVTVTASFKAVPSNANFSYPLYVSPGGGANNINGIVGRVGLNAGVVSLYMPAFGLKSGGTSLYPGGNAFGFPAPGSNRGQVLFNARQATDNTMQFVTLGISPVGFTQFVTDITTVGTQLAIVLRVNHTTTTTGQIGKSVASGGTDDNLNGSATTLWLASSDRDQARSATIPGVTLDQGSTFLFNSTVLGSATAPGLPTAINRDSGLNVRLVAQYATGTLSGVAEDVTNLFGVQFGARSTNIAANQGATAVCSDFVDNGAFFGLTDTNALATGRLSATVALLTNAAGAPAVTGMTKGQVLITSNAGAVAGNPGVTVGAKYPHFGAGQGGTAGNADKSGSITVTVP